MGWIDWIVLLSIGAVVVGIAVYLIVKKNKGGCGCGCSDCPHAGACCSSAKKRDEDKK